MINFLQKSKLNESKNSLTITYPRTVDIIFGNYPYIDIINNLIIEIKNNLNPNLENYTNVKGKMTDWKYFLKDKNKNFYHFMSYIINQNQSAYPRMFEYFYEKNTIIEAWGNKLEKGDSVTAHVHHHYHGILYLTEGSDLELPELNIKIKPSPGNYYIFPPEIVHKVNISENEKTRYSLIFNIMLDGFAYENKLKNGKES